MTHRPIVRITVGLGMAAAALGAWLQAREQARPAAPAGRLTIETLIDIKHPSNPVWSRDSRRIAFMWDRAGVSNLYVAPADGSTPPVAVTTDGAQVGGVFWSADGRTLLFTRGGALMQVSADGGPLRPVELPGRSAVFSRNGTRIAYLVGGSGGAASGRGGRGGGAGGSTRADQPVLPAAPATPTEIRVRAFAGGPERAVATFDGPVNGLAWTPDGERLTFTSGGGGGQSIRHEQTPEYSGTKIIYTVNENVPGTPGQNYVVPVAGGSPTPFTTGAGGGGGGRGGGANRWVGTTHVLVDRQTPDFKRRGVYVANIAGGEPTQIHEDVKTTFWSMTGGAGAASQVSPDGKWISFMSDRDGWDHIYVVPAAAVVAKGATPASAIVQVTKGQFEAWRPDWSPDGTRLAFDANEPANLGQRHLWVATMGEGSAAPKLAKVTSGRGTNTSPLWSPDGSRLVYQHTDPQNSADLWTIDVKTPGAKPVRLTDSLPAGIDRTALVAPELVHYPGPDGKPVPAYLFVPKDLNRAVRHPAIVWIHGDGVNQNYDGWHVQRNYAVYYSFHQYLLQQGYVVLAPDYRGSIGYGSAWREAVHMDVGGKDFKDAALGANYLKTLPYVDGDRLGVWGLSYGGFFTLLAVTEMPTLYRAAVNVAGVVDYAMYYEDPYHGGWTRSRIGTPEENPKVYAQASPISHIDRLARPLLVLHGTSDVNVPYLHSVRLIDELLKKGKGPLVEFMTYPGEFHYFTREHVLRDAWTRVDEFFKKHLNGPR